MASTKVEYTEHVHEPGPERSWGTSWLRFALLAAILLIVFWAII